MVVFDARTGVRYADSVLAASNAVSAASATAAVIRGALEKSHKNPNDLRTVGILGVRNADLPRALNGFCDAVGEVLERELLYSPEIAVLERRQLEHVNRERDLPISTPLRDLLASLVNIELEIGRGRGGRGYRATAHLTDGSGLRLDPVTVYSDERASGELAGNLREALTRTLKVAPPQGQPDRAREAERFHLEAEHFLEHRDFRRALPLAEAACALAPDRPVIRSGLAMSAISCAVDLIHPGGQRAGGWFVSGATDVEFKRSLDLAQRGLGLLAAPLPITAATERRIEAISSDMITDLYLSRFMEKILVLCQAPDGRTARNPSSPTVLEELLQHGTMAEFARVVKECPAPWCDAEADGELVSLASAYRSYKVWPVPKPAPLAVSTNSLAERLRVYLREGRGMTSQDVSIALNANLGGGDNPRAWLSLMNEALTVLESSDCRLSSWDRDRLKAHFEFDRHMLLRLHPDLGYEGTTPWSQVRQLLDFSATREGIRRMFSPHVEGDFVYVIGVGSHSRNGRDPYLELLRCSMSDGHLEHLCQVTDKSGVQWLSALTRPQVDHFFQQRYGLVTDYCAGRCYVSTGTWGIYIFPTNGGPVETIPAQGVWPSDQIRSLAALEGKLYVGTAEPGFLLAYDLKTKTCTVLASSTRKEKRSPFDDGAPFLVPWMTADAERHRIVFLARVLRNPRGGPPNDASGIWEMNVETGRIRCIAPLAPEASRQYWSGFQPDGRVMLDSGSTTLLLDLKTDKVEGLPPLYSARTLAPVMMHEGWVWSASPWRRTSSDGQRREYFQPLRADKPMDYFYPMECLTPVGNGRQILVGDQYNLWLLELPTNQ